MEITSPELIRYLYKQDPIQYRIFTKASNFNKPPEVLIL